MSNSSDNIKFSEIAPLTNENYRRDFLRVKAAIFARANDLSNFGFYDLTITLLSDAAFTAAHPPLAGGVAQHRLPPKPGNIADDAPANARIRHDRGLETFGQARQAERTLRAHAIRAFGPIGNRITTLGDDNYDDLTTAEMMEKMEAICKPTIEDTKVLRAAVNTWDESQDFETNYGHFSKCMRQLNALHICTSDSEKVTALETATAGKLFYSEVKKRYYTMHGANPHQFSQMIEFYREQIPYVLADSEELRRAQHAVAAAAEVEVLKAENAQLKAAAMAHATTAKAAPIPHGGGQRDAKAGRNGSGGRGAGRHTARGGHQSGRGKTAAASVEPYCYAHGRIGHPGTDCNKMKDDWTYTDAMKNATSPRELIGNDGLKYQGHPI